jgi:hypothetical protein
MTLLSYAEDELNRIGMTDEDEYNGMMRNHILHMVKVFADEGHSGFSAPYAIGILSKLFAFKPLTPLTGEDDEWIKHDYGVTPNFQNKRLSSVFKDGQDGEAYNIDGKVFWEWYKDEDGNSTKVYYTGADSHTPVTFPYDPPEKPIYEYRHSDAEPQSAPQTEEGFV